MADFKKAFAFVRGLEGGYVDDSDDPGGCTKDGVSIRFYRKAVAPNITCEELRTLRSDEIHGVYRDIWDEAKGFAIRSQELANKYFALQVHAGTYRATKILQKSTNSVFSGGRTLVEDGKFGLKTLAAVNSVFDVPLVEEFEHRTWEFYKKLMRDNPKLEKYKNGWKARAYA